MDELQKLSKNNELLHQEEHSSNLFEDAWHSFKSQSTPAIVAEVAVGAVALGFATRSLMRKAGSEVVASTGVNILSGESKLAASSAETALRTESRLATTTAAATLGTESKLVGTGILLPTERGLGRDIALSTRIDGGIFPANTDELRLALEKFGTRTAEKTVPAATVPTATLRASETEAVRSATTFQARPMFSAAERTLPPPPANDFSRIEDAMQRVRRSGFPRLE